MVLQRATPLKLQFGGGLNTLSGPLDIGENESPNCKNVHSDLAGTLQRRQGFTTLGSAASGTTGNGVFDYWSDSDTHYLMCYLDTYLYKIDSVSNAFDGTLDAITFGTAMADAQMEFAQFEDGGTNYLIMATHSRSKLQKWTGSGATTDLSADADLPAPKYITTWRGYLFCANVAGAESRVYYNNVASNIIGATDWDATDFQDITTHDADFITGQHVLRGRLFTYKRYSITRWTYLGGTPLFEVKTIIDGTGAASSKSIVNLSHPERGDVHVFLGSDARFYMFDGNQIYPISQKIESSNGVSEFDMSKVNKTFLSKAQAVDYKERHWYVCWVPTGTTNDWCLVWDYYTGAWWAMSDMQAFACGIGLSGGKQKLYFIEDANSGQVEEFDSGNADDDDTTAINAVYETKKINYGSQAMLKKQRHADVVFKNIGDFNMSFQRRSDWNQSYDTAKTLSMSGGGFILGTSLLGTGTLGGGEAVVKTVDLPFINKAEQFKFSTNNTDPPWTIFEVDVIGEGLGFGKSD